MGRMVCVELDEEDVRLIDSIASEYGLDRDGVLRLAVRALYGSRFIVGLLESLFGSREQGESGGG